MASTSTFTGNVPLAYETYLGPLFFESYALDLANRAQDNHYQNILEIACGTGRVTKHLVSKLSAGGKLSATDLNEAMLAVAREKIKDGRINWEVADAQILPYNDEEFDLVVCQFGVMFFPDKPKAFAETSRVLKTGGTFLFNTWDHLRHNTLSHLTQQALEEVFPVDTPPFLTKAPFSFFDQKEITQLLHDAGFTDITIETVQLTSTAESFETCISGIIDGTPISAALQERDASPETVKEKLKNLLEKEYQNPPFQLPMQALVCTAKKR